MAVMKDDAERTWNYLPTEAVGSIPRCHDLQDAIRKHVLGDIDAAALEAAYDRAVRATMAELEGTGSPIISDGEQRKTHSFASYSVDGGDQFAPDGLALPFADGHVRRLPRLIRGPFRFKRYAFESLAKARPLTRLPMKQAIISPSALSLFYPPDGIADYSRDEFIVDLLDEQEREIRGCLDAGAQRVQIDFTEGRLSLKLDPSGSLLSSFVELNNMVLQRFTPHEIERICVHTCPGADHDSTHSADVDYSELLPSLFELNAGSFCIAMAEERRPEQALQTIARHIKQGQRAYIGVIDVNDPRIETPELVCKRILQAAKYLPVDQLGSTDDCGFSPFCDDVSTSRETAFAKIRARVEGTIMASKSLGLA